MVLRYGSIPSLNSMKDCRAKETILQRAEPRLFNISRFPGANSRRSSLNQANSLLHQRQLDTDLFPQITGIHRRRGLSCECGE